MRKATKKATAATKTAPAKAKIEPKPAKTKGTAGSERAAETAPKEKAKRPYTKRKPNPAAFTSDTNPAKQRKGQPRPWKAGKPTHEPTELNRRMVQLGMAAGASQDAMAAVLGISRATLAEHYGAEIEMGTDKANLQVVARLFQHATSKDPRGIPAAIFWLKAKAGWSDKQQIDHTMRVLVVEEDVAEHANGADTDPG